MKSITRFCISLIFGLFIAAGASGQEKIGNGLEIDKMVHNFGDIMLDSGPVSCEFTITNKGSKPAVIYNVISSCGCTDVEWTKEPIMPGGSGKVSATYSNDEGPYPFDKSLTVYLSDVKKPLILKLRGISREKMRPLSELYPLHRGPMGMKEDMIRCGNLEQGGDKSETVMVANLSSKPIKVEFKDVTSNLKVSVSPNPIPAESTAELTATVSADRQKWGRNEYKAVPVIDGKEYEMENCRVQKSCNLVKLAGVDSDKELAEFQQLCARYPHGEAEFVTNPCGKYGTKNIVPKAWFGTPRRIPYLDMLLPVPEHTEEYLTHYYKDYMKYPPQEEIDRMMKYKVVLED
jgi:hypothetical protein